MNKKKILVVPLLLSKVCYYYIISSSSSQSIEMVSQVNSEILNCLRVLLLFNWFIWSH